jgi:ectoine hydroxylase-related dioxygenase (phytanoyl-CoA dioxygenase family)
MVEPMTDRVANCVPDTLVEDYAGDGAIVVRGLFSAAEIALLREGVDANIAAPSVRSIVASRPDDPGWFMEDFCNWQDNPAYRQFIEGTSIAAAAARLMRSRQVRLFHDHMLVKEPGTAQRTAWHQDQPYYNVDGRQNVSFWIPVDPVPEDWTLEFVAGSHVGPWLMPRTFMTAEARWFPAGSLEEIPDIEADREAHTILRWAIEPGDAVAFHMLTLHGAAGVQGTQRRRVFSVRLLGDDIVHAPRRWKTSPEFPGLSEELPAGSAMDHPLFPVLAQR